MSKCYGAVTAARQGARSTSSMWLSTVTNNLWAPVMAADIVPGLVVFSLQTNCFRVQLESGQDLLLLGDLGSVDLLHIRVQLLRSIMSKQTETRPKHIPILGKKKPNKQANKQTNNSRRSRCESTFSDFLFVSQRIVIWQQTSEETLVSSWGRSLF